MSLSGTKLSSSMTKLASLNVIVSAMSSVLAYIIFAMVAHLFGATSGTDIFLFGTAFTVVSSGLITTVFGAVFLPLYIRYNHDETYPTRALVFANSYFFRVLLIAAAGALLILIYPVQIFTAASRFESNTLYEHEGILRCFSVVFALTLINEFMRVLLQSREAFTTASLSVVLQTVVNLLCIMLLSGSMGYASLAIGIVTARIIQFIYLAWYIKKLGIGLVPSIKGNPDITEFLRIARPYWFASIISMGSLFSFDYVASGLPQGQLTAVAFSQKIYMLPISLIAMPVIEVLNTRLSILFAKGDLTGLNVLYTRSIKIAMFTMLPISIFLAADSLTITNILIGGGAYSLEHLRITAQSLAIYSMSIPLIVLFAINGRITLVFHKTKMPSFFGSVGHIVMIFAVWTFTTFYGYLGLSLAKFVVETLYFLPFGFIAAWSCLPSGKFREVFVEFSKIAISSLSALFSIWLLGEIMPVATIQPLIHILLSALIFSAVFLLISYLTKVECLKVLTAGLFIQDLKSQ